MAIKNKLLLSELKKVISLDKEASKEISWWSRTSKAEFRELNKLGNIYAIIQKDVVGFIRLKEDKRYKQKTSYLEDIYISKKFRGKNFGKKALKELLKTINYKLKIISPLKLQKYYESLGFNAKYIVLEWPQQIKDILL